MNNRNLTINDLDRVFQGGNTVVAHELRAYLRLTHTTMWRYMKRAGLSRPNAKYYLLTRQQVEHLIKTMLTKEGQR